MPVRPLAAALALSVLLLGGGAPGPAKSDASRPLVIGSISGNLHREMKKFEPLAAYVGARLTAGGLAGAKVAVVESGEGMVAALAKGAVDVYIDSPFIIAQIARRTPLTPFLRRWKNGVAEYHTVFATRGDSGIRTLDDLKGRVVAFDDDTSSSGYLLPKAMLLERGYRLAHVSRPETPVPADTIGYVFTGDDENTMFWLTKGKTAAGVTDPKHFDAFAAKKPGELLALARSADVPRHIVAHRGDLAPEIVRDVARVLMGMENDEAGREVLRGFDKTTRFDALPEAEATFATIHKMLDHLDDGARP